MLEEALGLAAAGWRVFPCRPLSKQPASAHGFLDATTEPAQIRRWWSERPDYNIGIATGGGNAVLDVDVKTADGFATLAALEAELGALPETFTVNTPSGGRHYYFAGTWPSSSNRLGPSIDTRGDGGYVLAPPSILSEGFYAVVSGDTMAPAPASWTERLQVGSPATHNAAPTAPVDGQPLLTDGRKAWIFRRAARLRGTGLDAELIESVLLHESPLVIADAHLYAAEIRRVALNVDNRYGPNPEPGVIRHGVPQAPISDASWVFTAAEIAVMDMPQVPPSLPFLGRSNIILENFSHILSAYPKAGKTTLLTQLILEWQATKTVLYLSEEDQYTWAPRIKKRPGWNDNVRIGYALAKPLDVLLQRAYDGDEQIVILDTARMLLQLENENDNSEVTRALKPWVALKSQGKTVIVVHHGNKAGGRGGRGVGGASAWIASFDATIELLEFDDDDRPNDRKVRTMGRAVPAAEYVYTMLGTGQLRMWP